MIITRNNMFTEYQPEIKERKKERKPISQLIYVQCIVLSLMSPNHAPPPPPPPPPPLPLSPHQVANAAGKRVDGGGCWGEGKGGGEGGEGRSGRVGEKVYMHVEGKERRYM